MDARPLLELYVTPGCPTCERAERVVRSCEPLNEVVRVQVCDLTEPEVQAPNSVIGVPALVFRGSVVGLGTPDCRDLTKRITALVASAPA